MDSRIEGILHFLFVYRDSVRVYGMNVFFFFFNTLIADQQVNYQPGLSIIYIAT